MALHSHQLCSVLSPSLSSSVHGCARVTVQGNFLLPPVHSANHQHENCFAEHTNTALFGTRAATWGSHCQAEDIWSWSHSAAHPRTSILGWEQQLSWCLQGWAVWMLWGCGGCLWHLREEHPFRDPATAQQVCCWCDFMLLKRCTRKAFQRVHFLWNYKTSTGPLLDLPRLAQALESVLLVCLKLSIAIYCYALLLVWLPPC